MSQDLNPEDQFLLGGGGQSAQFKNIGDYVDGIITATQVTQQTDLESGEALWWDPEKTRPRQQLVVSIQTEIRDPEVDDDDGVRKVYVKGSTKAGSRSLHDATAQAVRAAGAKGLKVGGWVRFHFVEEEPATKKGLSPRKLWQVTYRAPDGEAESGALLGTAQAAAPAPAPAPAPVAAPAPPPAPVAAPAPPPAPAPAAAPAAAPAGPSPVDAARAMIAAGVDDAVILAALPSLQPVVLQALRNNS